MKNSIIDTSFSDFLKYAIRPAGSEIMVFPFCDKEKRYCNSIIMKSKDIINPNPEKLFLMEKTQAILDIEEFLSNNNIN